MDYKQWLLKRYYQWRKYIPASLLYHADYSQVLQLAAADHATIDAVAQARLREVLRTAARHVPFYRRAVRLTDAELANEPVHEMLARFPYTDKNIVMASPRDFLDDRRNPRWLVYTTSSGSTGLGIGVWRTKRLADIEKAFFAHEWSRFGFSFDKSRYLRIGADAGRPAHEPPARAWGNRLLLSPYHINGGHRRAILESLNRFKPRYVHGYPSAVAALADLLDARELDFEVGAVLLASEPAEPSQLAATAKLFDCPVSISYGLTERTNLAFADYARGALGPYRFDPLYACNENRMSGGLPEIVGTSLWNDVMPLIRYRTGDYGAIGPDGLCATLDGREQEFIVDRHGNRIPGLSINIDNATWDFVRTYQIRQDRAGAITLALVPRDCGLSPAQIDFVLGEQLQRWGEFFDISVRVVQDLERTAAGKHRFVVSSLLTFRH
jgi:phenylacetate-CoA ligase